MRNHDEIRLWSYYLSSGSTGTGSRDASYIRDDRNRRGGFGGGEFVIMGDQNSDPEDGGSLQDAILSPLLGITPEVVTAGTNLRYKRTREEAVAEVKEGRAQITFLLEDLPIDGMARVSFGGQVLPQKSTYFYPKMGSGLVMLELES